MIKNIKYAIISNIGGVFLKKIFLVILTGIISVSVLGCKTNEANIEKSVEILASKSDDSIEKLEDSDFNNLIKDTFEDDNNIKFKKEKTKEFIKKVNDASEYFDAKDFESINPSVFEKIDEESSIYFERVAKDEKGIRNLYVNKLCAKLSFNDEAGYEYVTEKFDLWLCDEDGDGKIDLTDESKKLLKLLDKDIDLEKVEISMDKTIESLGDEIAKLGSNEVFKEEKGIEYSVIGVKFSDRPPVAIIRLSVDSEYDN